MRDISKNRRVNGASDGVLDFVDGDLEMIANYVADELSQSDRRAVEQRLVADADFFDRALPFMQLRGAKLGIAKALDYTPPTPGSERVEEAAEVPRAQTKARSGYRRFVPRERYVWAAMGLAAGFALFAPLLLLRSVGVEGQDGLNRGDVRAVADAKDLQMPNGSDVHLEPGARIRYDAGMTPHRMVATLEGQATITVPAGQDSIIVMRNSGLVALAAGGTYDLNAPRSDPHIYVAVHSGTATMEQFGTSAVVRLAKGDRGEMDKVPRLVGHTADGSRGA